ncbi:MAG: prolyl oligopeptidase family serine peptidase [Planctomycetota bacterium]
MKHSFNQAYWNVIVASLFAVGLGAAGGAEEPVRAPVQPVVEDYHGVRVTDPYRYMEDFQQPAVQQWVKAQADFAQQQLEKLPGRSELLARIKQLDAGTPYTISNITRLPSGDLFYFKQAAGENVAKIYVRDARTGTEQQLIDPDTFKKSHPAAHVSLAFYQVSPTGQKLLFGFAESGSEQTSIQVFDRATGRILPDTIDRIEAEYALPDWLPDGESFVYSRRRAVAAGAPAADGYKFTQAFRHTLGAAVEQTVPVFAQGAPGSPPMAEMDFPAVIVPTESRWVIGQVRHGDETDLTLYVADRAALGTAEVTWRKVCDRSDQVTSFAVHGDDIFLVTAQRAPRFQVLRTTLAQPNLTTAAVIVPPGKYVVNSVAVARDALYVGILDGVPNRILRVPFEAGAKPQAVTLPDEEPSGTLVGVSADVAGAFISTRSWTRAERLYQFDPQTGALTDTQLLARGEWDAPDFIQSTDVLVTSHDGVQVPLSIIHRRDLQRDGSHPTLLSGYGAYGFTATMRFQPTDLAWLERGGILAIAHVRGGGAFGKEWHHAGRKQTKPNTWKDFLACAEYLVRERYTSPAKLTGAGGSAGGILIGRAITERPDLFAAAHISVGCTDMLRFETTMNGPPNIPEFGTTTKPDEFRSLLAMSTLHQIRDGVRYPAVILTHGINDPRVEPWLSAKTTARLQAATASGKPVLFRVDYEAGHGIGSTKAQRHQERADVWSFLLHACAQP